MTTRTAKHKTPAIPSFDAQQCAETVSTSFELLAQDSQQSDDLFVQVNEWAEKYLKLTGEEQTAALSSLHKQDAMTSASWSYFHDVLGQLASEQHIISASGKELVCTLKLIPFIALGCIEQEQCDFDLPQSLTTALMRTFRENRITQTGNAVCLPFALTLDSANIGYGQQRRTLQQFTDAVLKKIKGSRELEMQSPLIPKVCYAYTKPKHEHVGMTVMLRFIPVITVFEDPEYEATEADWTQWQVQFNALLSESMLNADVIRPHYYAEDLRHALRLFDVIRFELVLKGIRAERVAFSATLTQHEESDILITIRHNDSGEVLYQQQIARLPQHELTEEDVDLYLEQFSSSEQVTTKN